MRVPTVLKRLLRRRRDRADEFPLLIGSGRKSLLLMPEPVVFREAGLPRLPTQYPTLGALGPYSAPVLLSGKSFFFARWRPVGYSGPPSETLPVRLASEFLAQLLRYLSPTELWTAAVFRDRAAGPEWALDEHRVLAWQWMWRSGGTSLETAAAAAVLRSLSSGFRSRVTEELTPELLAVGARCGVPETRAAWRICQHLGVSAWGQEGGEPLTLTGTGLLRRADPGELRYLGAVIAAGSPRRATRALLASGELTRLARAGVAPEWVIAYHGREEEG